ncbi:Glu/Leu/Phe/Val dehydrogenase [candidate division KSB1 bacterium]|nr:Glu/Leu/Phe/Val dehydrogenase [candidate division KSB1 bacterium]
MPSSKSAIVKDREPLLVIEYHDERFDAKGYLVIDMLVNGVAGGGCRMKKGVTPEEMIKLAETMTRKFTLIEPHIGGAKCGIDFDPTRPEKLLVMQRFFEYIRSFLFNCYVTGADLNTNENEIIACTRAIGLPCPQYALAKSLGNAEQRIRRFTEGINLAVDSRGHMLMNDAATGYGIRAAAQRAVPGHDLRGCSVAIQGFGNVGGSLAKFLYESGAKVQAISDRFGTVYCEKGLDVELLLTLRDERTKAVFPALLRAEQRPAQYELLSDTDAIYSCGDDLFFPVADSGIINENNYRKIKARYIVCGANAPFAEVELEEKLFALGKVVVPDFIANAGTAALYNTLMREEGPVSVASLRKSVEEQIGVAADEALQKSVREKISPRVAAEIIAAEKINAYPAKYLTAISKRWH